MGAEFKDEKPEPVIVEEDETPMLFGDPKSYEHLPMEERKEMTKRMKSNLMSKLTLGQRK
jgi:hypothetical protein